MVAISYSTVVPTNVRRILRAKGMKHCVLADRAGFTQQQMSDMLNGRRTIKAGDVPALALGLGVDINTLYEPLGQERR